MRVGAGRRAARTSSGASGEVATAEVERLFAEVGLPKGSERNTPRTKRGPKKQRVMIARPGLQPEGVAGRRTDDGPRRDRAARDPRLASGIARREGPRGDVRDARPRRGEGHW